MLFSFVCYMSISTALLWLDTSFTLQLGLRININITSLTLSISFLEAEIFGFLWMENVFQNIINKIIISFISV